MYIHSQPLKHYTTLKNTIKKIQNFQKSKKKNPNISKNPKKSKKLKFVKKSKFEKKKKWKYPKYLKFQYFYILWQNIFTYFFVSNIQEFSPTLVLFFILIITQNVRNFALLIKPQGPGFIAFWAIQEHIGHNVPHYIFKEIIKWNVFHWI